MTSKLPTLFIPHGGGPCFFMDWTWGPPDTWQKMGEWLASVPASINATPKAIVAISGHWEEAEFTVATNPEPSLIFDYSGFPEHTYRLTYPAPGSPKLSARVQALLTEAGIPARTDGKRGFDHGVFIPFKMMYPEANIPIVQLSLKKGLDPAEHLAAGRALNVLREEDVLIVGSGMSYHNMGGFGGSASGPSDEFDAWLTQAVESPTDFPADHPADSSNHDTRDQLLRAWAAAPSARAAHPREEHLLPLMVAAGAAGLDTGRKVFSDRVMSATVSAFQFGPSPRSEYPNTTG